MMARLSLLQLTDDRLHFGCVKAHHFYSRKHCIILFYDGIRRQYSNVSPVCDAVYLCSHLHESVYIPVFLVNMNAWILRSTRIPDDLLYEHFDLVSKINRWHDCELKMHGRSF